MTIGEKIRELRLEQNVTQEKLARALQISSQAVSKWENGTGNPDVSMVAPLCCFFGVSADELCGVENEHLDEIYRENESRGMALYAEGKIAELLAFWREAARRYPRHWPTLSQLVFACGAAAHTYERVPDGEEYRSLIREKIGLGEEILAECNDQETRDFTIINLLPEYLGENTPESLARMRRIVKNASDIHASKQFLRRYTDEGEDWERNAQELIIICLRTAADLLKKADTTEWDPDFRREVRETMDRLTENMSIL